MSRGRIIGIDLGTTNSCAAIVERGAPRILATPAGERTLPSVVAWTQAGEIVSGTQAVRQAVSNAQSTVFGTKRLIGRKFDEKE